MSITVYVPGFLRDLTAGEAMGTVVGGSVRDAIAGLDAAYPGFAERLLDDSGLRRNINIYANDKDVRYADGLDTALADGDSLTILPAVPSPATPATA